MGRALTAIMRTPEAKVTKRRADMPCSCRRLYDKVVAGTASPRQAIKSFCLECMGWNRKEVAACNAVACPLFRYRPWQPSDGDQK